MGGHRSRPFLFRAGSGNRGRKTRRGRTGEVRPAFASRASAIRRANCAGADGRTPARDTRGTGSLREPVAVRTERNETGCRNGMQDASPLSPHAGREGSGATSPRLPCRDENRRGPGRRGGAAVRRSMPMRKTYVTKKKTVLVLIECGCQIAFVRFGSDRRPRRFGPVAVSSPATGSAAGGPPHPPAAFPCGRCGPRRGKTRGKMRAGWNL